MPVRRFIERELRDYPKNLKEIEKLREALMFDNMSTPTLRRCNAISDPTAHKAVLLISNTRLAYLERTLSAIKSVLIRLDNYKYKMLELKYWPTGKHFTDDRIALELNCSETTLYKWNNAVLYAIALNLGLI